MTLLPGARLGPYEIVASLGIGGMGEVYRARDPRLAREVAIKVLSKIEPDRQRRFEQEARAASALNHPNILVIHDVCIDVDRPYIVSELVDGQPLRRELLRGTLAPRPLLDLAVQIADGLAAAHAAGIVHRDLKPENIMVTPAGRVKILDFGLAKTAGPEATELTATTGASTITERGLIIGTVPYMSPEQARGDQIDFRSDQFSFGLILYEMATGKAAFSRHSAVQTLHAIISEEPPSIASLNPNIPAPVRWLIERCLAKDPRERYASTADLHHDLRMLRERLTEAVALEGTLSVRQRDPGRKLLSLGLMLLVAAGIGFISWPLLVEPPATTPASYRFTPLATDAAYEGFPVWSPDGKTVAYVAEVNGVLQVFARSLASATPQQITDAPFDCKYPFWSPDGTRIYYTSRLRDGEGIWSISAAGGVPEPVIANVARAAISPDGNVLAFFRDEFRLADAWALWLASPPDAEPRRYEIPPLRDWRFAEATIRFSPDGSRIGIWGMANNPAAQQATSTASSFWVVPYPSGEPYMVLQSTIARFPGFPSRGEFSWLPDNSHVVFGGTAGAPTPSAAAHLWMANLRQDNAWPLTFGTGTESHPSLSATGNRIVYTSEQTDYDIVEVSRDASGLRPLLATARNESDPVWSPVGSEFAYVNDRNGIDEIWLNSPQGRWQRPVVTEQDFGDARTLMLRDVAFSPEGQRIAYLRDGQGALRIWISPIAGGPPVRLLAETRVGEFEGSPTWSPDGQWIAYFGWKQGQWYLAKARVGTRERVELSKDVMAHSIPRWSPKGDWISCNTAKGFAMISPDGTQVRMLSDEPLLVHAWSADGATLYGVKRTEDLQLSLVAFDVRTGVERPLADLGPSPVANNPLKGFSVARDGRSFLTSIVRLRGDLYILDGFATRAGLLDRFWRWLR